MPRGVYRIVSFNGAMGNSAAASQQVNISAVAKRNGPNAPYCVPNELICGELGRFLGLPVPPAGVMRTQSTETPFWFASLDFNFTGDTLPAVDPSECVDRLPDLSTGLLLFDILVANSDRHRWNIALDTVVDPPRLSVFDHSHALFGSQQGQGQSRLNGLRDRLGVSQGSHSQGNRHCLLDVISTDDYFEKWLGRIGSIPDFMIEELCQETIELGATDAEANVATDFLSHRRDNLWNIIDGRKDEFKGIGEWRLVI